MRSSKTVLLACCAAFAVAGCRSCEPERPRVQQPPEPVRDRPTVLAVLLEDARPADPSKSAAAVKDHPAVAARPAGDASPVPSHANLEFTFGARGGGVVWIAPHADRKYRVFHDGHPGPPYEEIGIVAISRDGVHHAYAGRIGEEWRVVVDGKEALGAFREVGAPRYSRDGAHLAFQVRIGETYRMVVDGTPHRNAPSDYLGKDFSADSRKVVFLEPVDAENARLVVADPEFRSPAVVAEHVSFWTMSEDKTRVAAVEAVDGGVRVLSFEADRPDRIRRGKRYERVAQLALGQDGAPLGYYALRSGQTLFVLEEDEIPLGNGEQVVSGAAPRPGLRGFGALVSSGGKTTYRQYLMDAAPPEPSYEEAAGLTYGAEGRLHAYVARRGTSWFVVANGKEGPPFDAVRPPEFSADGGSLVYRARREGRRFVVIADPDGRTRRELPSYEQVFDVRFTADGRSIAYGVKDGRELAWKVEPLR